VHKDVLKATGAKVLPSVLCAVDDGNTQVVSDTEAKIIKDQFLCPLFDVHVATAKNLAEAFYEAVRAARRLIVLTELLASGEDGKKSFDKFIGKNHLYIEGLGTSPLPDVLNQCLSFINTKGLKEPGLFRVPGNHKEIVTLKSDPYLNLDKYDDILSVGGLLKVYLSSQSEPLIPYELYPYFIRAQAISDTYAKVENVLYLIDFIPFPQKDYLRSIMHTLRQIIQYSTENCLSARDLAHIFAPFILKSKISTGVLVDELKTATYVVEIFIVESSLLFRIY